MNRFIINPTESDVTEVEQSFGFCLQDLIVLGIEDFLNIVHEADNAVVLEGLGKGETRMEDTVEDLIVKARLVMPDKHLFTSKNILIQIISDEASPLVIEEMAPIKNLIDDLGSETNVTWGISKQKVEEPFTTAIRLFASNIR